MNYMFLPSATKNELSLILLHQWRIIKEGPFHSQVRSCKLTIKIKIYPLDGVIRGVYTNAHKGMVGNMHQISA